MITSTSNERVKWIRSLQARRRNRYGENRFVAEGVRWAGEFLQADHTPDSVFFREPLSEQENNLLAKLAAMGTETTEVSAEVMAAMSDTESPQALLLVAPFPKLKIPAQPTLLVVVDQLADPGNLGTLLRTSLAAGVEALILTQGTVDPFNPKVIRAGMGAQLNLPIVWSEADKLRVHLNGLPLWLAETGQGPAHSQVDWKPACALLIGSEAHGARQRLIQMADHFTHIPMQGPADSLNAAVAAAVILFEIQRQRGQP